MRQPAESQSPALTPEQAGEPLIRVIDSIAAARSGPVLLFTCDRDGILTFLDGGLSAELCEVPGALVGRSLFSVLEDYPELGDLARRLLGGERLEFASVAHPPYHLEVWGRAAAQSIRRVGRGCGDHRGHLGACRGRTVGARWRAPRESAPRERGRRHLGHRTGQCGALRQPCCPPPLWAAAGATAGLSGLSLSSIPKITSVCGATSPKRATTQAARLASSTGSRTATAPGARWSRSPTT